MEAESLCINLNTCATFRQKVELGFLPETRQSGMRDGHQSGACATTHGRCLLLPCVHVAVLLRFLRFSFLSAVSSAYKSFGENKV
jgi:hypothetical protein